MNKGYKVYPYMYERPYLKVSNFKGWGERGEGGTHQKQHQQFKSTKK